MALLLVVTSGVVVVAWRHSSPRPPGGRLAFDAATQTAKEPLALATVDGRPYDGDSVRVILDGERVELELAEIDAPELDQPGGAEARAFVRGLLDEGESVLVLPRGKDRYGRMLADVWYDGGEHLNNEIVRAGWAWAYAPDTNDRLRKHEAGAREAGRGLWAMRDAGGGLWLPHGAIEPRAWRKRGQ